MKKLLLIGLLLATIVPAQAITWTMSRLLSGTNMQWPQNTTNNFYDTNIIYVKFAGTQTYLLPAGSSNAVVVAQTAPWVWSFNTTNLFLYASSNGTIVTNYTIVASNNAAGAFQDAGIWPDVNGDSSALWFTAILSTSNAASSAAVTNSFYFQVETANNGYASDTNSYKFIGNIPTGTNLYVFTTNLVKTGFTDGSQAIRLRQVGNGGSVNLILNDAFISGWKP
jgi:hypothetical protein